MQQKSSCKPYVNKWVWLYSKTRSQSQPTPALGYWKSTRRTSFHSPRQLTETTLRLKVIFACVLLCIWNTISWLLPHSLRMDYSFIKPLISWEDTISYVCWHSFQNTPDIKNTWGTTWQIPCTSSEILQLSANSHLMVTAMLTTAVTIQASDWKKAWKKWSALKPTSVG